MYLTPKRLGMRLKKLRLAQRMSQDALARKAKITREYVNKLEAGRYDPTIGVIQRLAKALKVNVKDLLTS
jgi:transcriptional regulator with XRE-family HTH domain